MVAHGGDIYRRDIKLDFSANLNYMGMPPSVAEAARSAVDRADRYPDPQCRRLTAALSKREGIPAAHILCGNGAAELIYSLAAALRPASAVLCAPSFEEYRQALSAAGARIRTVFLKEETGFSCPEEELTAAVTPGTGLLVLCQPGNPTGQPVPPALFRRLLARCEAAGTRLLIDECFTECMEEPERWTAVPLLEDHPQLIVLKAFTKTFAMAGLRLGYLMTADEALMARMREVRQPWSVSVIAQEAGVAACREGEFLARYRRALAAEKGRLYSELTAMGLRVCGGAANFLLFRGPAGLGERLLEEGIQIRDCSLMEGLGAGWFRTAVRSREENTELIRAIRGIMEREEAWQRQS